jgi:hypothetical protein
MTEICDRMVKIMFGRPVFPVDFFSHVHLIQ